MIPDTGRRRRQAGFTALELLLVMAIALIISAIAAPLMLRAIHKSRRTALAADGRAVYEAFTRFQSDNAAFPSTSTPPSRAFNLTTMAPLTTGHYVLSATAFTSKLLNGRFTAYDSPNVGGSDSQFWAVMTLARDTSLVLLVANTDQYPGFEGKRFDGLYFIEGADIIPVGAGT